MVCITCNGAVSFRSMAEIIDFWYVHNLLIPKQALRGYIKTIITGFMEYSFGYIVFFKSTVY